MEDLGPPDLLEFLTEANLLPPAVYLQLQNSDLDGNATESDTLISLGPIASGTIGQGVYRPHPFPTKPGFAQNPWADHSPADGRVALAHKLRCDSHLN